MRIYFISPYSPRTVNGIGTFMMGLAKYLKEHDHEPVLITKYEDGELDINTVFDSENIIEIKHTKLKKFATIHHTILAIVEIFKHRHKIDILHLQQTYMLSAFCAFFGKLFGMRVVTTAHLKESESNPLKKPINFVFIAITMQWSDKVVYVSEETKASFGSNRGVVIRNGIDMNQFISNNSLRSEMRQKLQLDDQFILLFASRWTANKGIFDLLKALSVVTEKTDKKVKLVLIGSGEKDKVLSEIESLNISKHVLLIGTVKSVYEFYCMADVFILPSHLEGLPMALLEAMACGLPSIASRVGGNPELVSSWKNGILIEPNNLEDLVEKIMWCLKHEENLAAIGQSATKTVRERFSIKKTGEAYINVYINRC